MEMYALVYGDLVDGFTFVGPFDSKEEAIRYMDEEKDRDGITLVFLNAPCWGDLRNEV